MLEYKETMVKKALVIEIPNDVEVLIRKKKSRSNLLKLLKDVFNVESRDSKDKYSAMSVIHDRITFK